MTKVMYYAPLTSNLCCSLVDQVRYLPDEMLELRYKGQIVDFLDMDPKNARRAVRDFWENDRADFTLYQPQPVT